MAEVWTPRRQGDAGEISALESLSLAGAYVAIALLTHPDYDLIADWGERVERVQVKTSSCRVPDRFVVQLSTRGGNRSWNRTIKYLDASRCDSLFVHVADGRRWYIPARALGPVGYHAGRPEIRGVRGRPRTAVAPAEHG